jgi:apolipoprotein N-acyltransferase
VYLLPFISGTLTVFAYPPFSIPVLPFVGLVPFFYWLGRPRSGNEIVLGGFAFAAPYFLGNIYWMFNLVSFTSAGWLGAFGSILMHGLTFLLFPIAVGVVRRHTKIPLPLIVPFAWTISENARSFGDLAFPWVTLGYSLSEWPLLIQHADVVGVWGISWWLALVNALIATMILERGNTAALKRWGLALAVVVMVPAIYDIARWQHVENKEGNHPPGRRDPAQCRPGNEMGPGLDLRHLQQGQSSDRRGGEQLAVVGRRPGGLSTAGPARRLGAASRRDRGG